MTRLPLVVLALLVMIALPCSSQQHFIQFSGTVRDSATNEALAAAILRVQSTTRGTITNTEGQFMLSLEAGRSMVIVSSLGYAADTLILETAAPIVRDVHLVASDIILPEVMATTEDPALAIIREAIAQKHLWSDRLLTFKMEAFTRQVLSHDTSIASITESFTRGYWRTGDTLREVIVQRRQTANIPQSFNYAAVGALLNFNDDRIRFVGYEFVGPTAVDALEYYDYKLIKKRTSGLRDVYDIQMIPRTRLTPLFSGTVSIAGDSYALVGVDVEPNEAFTVPFVHDRQLRYRQEFALCDSMFWMPVDIRINARFVVGMPGLSVPPIKIEQTSVVTSYEINVPVPDSVFQKPRISVDSSASAQRDTAYWASHDVLPLAAQEDSAYKSLDSTQTLESQFRPTGILASLGGEQGNGFKTLSLLDLTYNRVEGPHAGVKAALDSLMPSMHIRGGIAYGFSSHTSSLTAGATWFTSNANIWGIGFDWYRRYNSTPGWNPYDALFNGITALLVKEDYYDYYHAVGWNAFVSFTPSKLFAGRLTFLHEQHASAAVSTNYSIFNDDKMFRFNPEAVEGRLRSMRLDVRIGLEEVPLGFITRNALQCSIEHASPSFASNDFSFTEYNMCGTAAIPTFGNGFLFKPQLRFRFAAGLATGTVPPQRYMSVESSASGAAMFGAMHVMDIKEFVGTRYVALNVEHNFRSLPFLMLGIPFLYKNTLDLIVHGGVANAWGGNVHTQRPQGWYEEAGVGLSRILEILRLDATWRLSAPGGFAVTITAASLF